MRWKSYVARHSLTPTLSRLGEGGTTHSYARLKKRQSMFSTSQDILNLAKTVGVIVLSAVIAWFVYYLAMIMRQMFLIVKEMRARINKVDELIKTVKEKIEHSTSYLLLISEGMKKVIEIAKDYTGKEKRKKK